MSVLATALLAELDDQALDQLAALLAPRIAVALAVRGASQKEAGWLNSDQAAEYLGCPRSRIHDLVALRRLEPRRDGRRLLFRRSDLDAYLEGSS